MDPSDERIIHLLSERTTQTVLTTLWEADGPIGLTELVDGLLANEDVERRANRGDRHRTELLISLHHNQLPKLDAAGVLSYDHEARTVTPAGQYPAATQWRDLDAIDELLSRFDVNGRPDSNSIGVLEGSEQIYQYSRDLAARADDELFLIYTSEELLHEDCLPHARNALDRGVSLYAGAKSVDARRFFRECLPEATVWEPQFDWMYDGSTAPTISRLIFADRETAVVGLWDNGGVDGERREIAMVGDGATNPLVVLLRELLGPRLDHLDYQSDDFLSSLPFEG